MKLAKMQALVTQGLKSGGGKRGMEELRNEARNKAETLRALTP